jgi:hypothetical protein
MKLFTKEDKKRINAAWRNPSVPQAPTELHALAFSWNWDDDLKPMSEIIRSPICDKGTALLIYWYAGPVWLYQTYANEDEIKGSYERERYRLVKEIEEKYTSGFYKSETINFDPSRDWPESYRGETLKQEIPEVMLKPSSGKKLSATALWLDESL